MHYFYTPEVLQPAIGDVVTLPAAEGKHANTVLRLSAGNVVTLINGVGGLFEADIMAAAPNNTTVKITAATQNYNPLPYSLHIAISPTKAGDRFEWFLEKAVEIGVTEITPVICTHTERAAVNQQKLEKTVISACKQSGRAWFPVINPQQKFSALITKPLQGNLLIAHCESGLKQTLAQVVQHHKNHTILIGPEGDFSPAEISMALEAGFKTLSLGSSRLRTETAGVYVCAALSVLNT